MTNSMSSTAIATSGFTYGLGAMCGGLMYFVGTAMEYTYKSLGVQLPGATELFYAHLIGVEAVLVMLAVAAVILSFIRSLRAQCASLIVINVVVFVFTLFVSVSVLPFLPNTEHLGNAQPSYFPQLLPFFAAIIVMSPFHVMSAMGLRAMCLVDGKRS